MRRRRVPERLLWTWPPRVVWHWHSPATHSHVWRYFLSAMLWCLLSLIGSSPPGAAAEVLGFAQDCSSFAHDALLSRLWPGTAVQEAESSTAFLSAMVPEVSLSGTALATVSSAPAEPAPQTLEAVFGLTPGAQRQIIETTFTQDARAVVLSPTILATVAHALTPGLVTVQSTAQTSVQTVPLRVTGMTALARALPGATGITLHVAHVNAPYDLALASMAADERLRPFPYPGVLSYGTGNPARPSGGLQAGDCVAALMTWRDEVSAAPRHRLALGKVLAKVPVATNALTQTTLNVNMFTTDIPAEPGDSGSPVLALQGGKPVLVGLVSATMYPAATFTYVTRIDPLLALASALQHAPAPPATAFLARQMDSTSPQEQAPRSPEVRR
ncbi:MAG: hypothetical protein AB7N91_12355 [Candidatus Tectimicrobiota bacterium]